MISLLLTLVIVCLIAYVIWWALNQIPLPQPLRVVAVVLFAVILVLILLQFLPLGGGPYLHGPLWR